MDSVRVMSPVHTRSMFHYPPLLFLVSINATVICLQFDRKTDRTGTVSMVSLNSTWTFGNHVPPLSGTWPLMTAFAGFVCSNGLKTSSISFCPFRGICRYFFVSFNDFWKWSLFDGCWTTNLRVVGKSFVPLAYGSRSVVCFSPYHVVILPLHSRVRNIHYQSNDLTMIYYYRIVSSLSVMLVMETGIYYYQIIS
jgi:hypothetical protein